MKLQTKKRMMKKQRGRKRNLTELLSKTGRNSVPFEFEFFTGGKNEKFDEISGSLGLPLII